MKNELVDPRRWFIETEHMEDGVPLRSIFYCRKARDDFAYGNIVILSNPYLAHEIVAGLRMMNIPHTHNLWRCGTVMLGDF